MQNLTLAYTLAGADCVDVAADPAVIASAREALQVASQYINDAQSRGYGVKGLPWLMVSLNDGEDPHFRKASFDPALCPPDCSRPCESICPAQAIAFPSEGESGVIDSRCYGCGRCVPICPIQHITTRAYVSTPAAIAPLVLDGVDAVEIHTQVGRLEDFTRLWQAIAPWVGQLKLVAVSCPDGDGLLDYLRQLYDCMAPLPCPVIWQTDGRPMSGDIGMGATRAAVKLGQKVLAANLPGYVQLAGGTNAHTVAKLQALNLLNFAPSGASNSSSVSSAPSASGSSGVSSLSAPAPRYIAGIAYGSYARALLTPVLDALEAEPLGAGIPSAPLPRLVDPSHTPVSPVRLVDFAAAPARLDAAPHLLWQAVGLAHSLVSQLKLPSTQSAPRSPMNQ
ncbi:MAG TPA: LdpA C-terminal domain-containing domain, partial [Chroococcidiopsis sp.]